MKTVLVALLCLVGYCAQATDLPVCPVNASSSVTYPSFPAPGEPPSVSTWRKLSSIDSSCYVAVQAPAKLVVAIAASFEFNGSIDELAERLGAVSQTEKLVYWSVTNDRWQALVDKAYAIRGADTDTRRSDFSGPEVLSGARLYFAQNDWQSWGMNVFEFESVSSSADHIVLRSQNTSRIRFGPITMFQPNDALSVLFVNEIEPSLWTYYSLSVIKNTPLPLNQKSIINRQAALYRNFVGLRLDKEPPLAP